jgi:hypothetical protein
LKGERDRHSRYNCVCVRSEIAHSKFQHLQKLVHKPTKVQNKKPPHRFSGRSHSVPPSFIILNAIRGGKIHRRNHYTRSILHPLPHPPPDFHRCLGELHFSRERPKRIRSDVGCMTCRSGARTGLTVCIPAGGGVSEPVSKADFAAMMVVQTAAGCLAVGLEG